MTTDRILLRPRPYARSAGALMLLPLLPTKTPVRPLPVEIWTRIFAYVLKGDPDNVFNFESRLVLLLVCKTFKDVAMPLLYDDVNLSTVRAFESFVTHLHASDKKWDSIRRIPHSTPGRWVRSLNLSNIAFQPRSDILLLDTLLSRLFPLVPLLTHLTLNPSLILSRRAMEALAASEASSNLKSFQGLGYVPATNLAVEEDPLVRLLCVCPNLREFEVVGHGFDPLDVDQPSTPPKPLSVDAVLPVQLPNLTTLTLLSMHSSPVLIALIRSPLQSLRKLTITPYDDIAVPDALTSHFIQTHGRRLRSLLLFTSKSWPTRPHPSPTTLLHTCPALLHLSLENPLPVLVPPGPDFVHPLQILSIPRPCSEFWGTLEELLGRLCMLRAVRFRDVRWLRQGMTTRALEAGVQGEMREWRRYLNRRGIRLLDADWKESQ